RTIETRDRDSQPVLGLACGCQHKKDHEANPYGWSRHGIFSQNDDFKVDVFSSVFSRWRIGAKVCYLRISFCRRSANRLSLIFSTSNLATWGSLVPKKSLTTKIPATDGVGMSL